MSDDPRSEVETQRQAEAAARRAARRVVVDGEEFAVWTSTTAGVPGVHYEWLSGPNPGYGFGGSWRGAEPPDDDEAATSIRSFLSAVDPATGYFED